MTKADIEVLETGIRIRELFIQRKEVAEFLRSKSPEEREATVIRSIEVGVFCLERAHTTLDVEFVRRQVESLLSRVEEAVSAIPGRTQTALIEKIGTANGQVLAPVSNLISETSQVTSTRLADIRTLLANDLDPSKETSTVGMALQKLRNMLDPQRTDSIQATICNALGTVTAENGLLATVVRTMVAEAVKPLEAEVRDLAKEVRGQEAATEALEQTIEKGGSYEEQVVEELLSWASAIGAEVHHVGGDNSPGDILLKLSPSSVVGTAFTVVIEARDRQSPMGRKAITDTISRAMGERNADAGVYVSRTSGGLGKEIGEWAEGACDRGGFVACIHSYLITALRFLIVQERLARLRASMPEVDSARIEEQSQRIRTSLERVKTINRKVSEVRGSAQGIQDEAEAIRDEIRAALTEIEYAIRESSPANLT